ncbi:MAG: flagellar basal body-associated FliL family protein [Acidobacteria bacterium]|nr:flagellar basal body-associated FliL family protein [Acidobacteriota bacterium]
MDLTEPGQNQGGGETRRKSRAPLLIGILVLLLIASAAGFFASSRLINVKEKDAGGVKATLKLEPFLVNLADEGEANFVKATISLGLAAEPKEETWNDVTVAAVRDSVISLLSSKKAEQILTPQGKDTLRKEIRSKVNSVSPDLNVLEVYIVDFVVQL